MGKTKNKGEASEFYAFVYILGNQLVPVVDGTLTATNQSVQFNSLKRADEDYIFQTEDRIKVLARGDTFYISRKDCKKYAADLLHLLFAQDKIQEDDPTVQKLFNLLRTEKISAKSQDKMDFSAEVCEPQSPLSRYLGFSVKSYIGNDPTVINANRNNSSVRFVILKNGETPTKEEMSPFLNLDEKRLGPKELFSKLLSEGFTLKYSSCGGEALEYNLRLIDSSLPEILAQLLVARYVDYETKESFASLVKKVAEKPEIPEIAELGDSVSRRENSLTFKLQNFLFAFSTGATVSRFWDGQEQATGGIIIVTKNGRVQCLELTTRNAIGQYLMNFSYFDNPSTSRHGYGRVFAEPDGKYYVDMQLQVRIGEKEESES